MRNKTRRKNRETTRERERANGERHNPTNLLCHLATIGFVFTCFPFKTVLENPSSRQTEQNQRETGCEEQTTRGRLILSSSIARKQSTTNTVVPSLLLLLLLQGFLPECCGSNSNRTTTSQSSRQHHDPMGFVVKHVSHSSVLVSASSTCGMRQQRASPSVCVTFLLCRCAKSRQRDSWVT